MERDLPGQLDSKGTVVNGKQGGPQSASKSWTSGTVPCKVELGEATNRNVSSTIDAKILGRSKINDLSV